MMSFQDYFSGQATEYARYRPRYPGALFQYLASLASRHELAWDSGTGNGQAALELANHFRRVVATDASPEQLQQAFAHDRIEYRLERAEEVSLKPDSVDLITVAIAVHWFNLPAFYQAVRRVSAPGALLAVWTYHLPAIDERVDGVLRHLYSEVLADFWPAQIRLVDDHYQTLDFPFNELTTPQFAIHTDWTLVQFAGFIESWSATRRYKQQHLQHPVRIVWPHLLDAWGDARQPKAIQWPLHLRVGRVKAGLRASAGSTR